MMPEDGGILDQAQNQHIEVAVYNRDNRRLVGLRMFNTTTKVWHGLNLTNEEARGLAQTLIDVADLNDRANGP